MMSAEERSADPAMVACQGDTTHLWAPRRTRESINRRERIAQNYARRACEGLGGIPKGQS